MERQDGDLASIWRQKQLPVIFRQSKSKPLLVKLPYLTDNLAWLKGDSRRLPLWNPQYQCWEIPVAWFDDIIIRALQRFTRVYVIQLHREQQRCAPACWNAQGFHCECSCMGAHHGSGHPGNGWHEVSETFAFSWKDKQYACRLIAAKKAH